LRGKVKKTEPSGKLADEPVAQVDPNQPEVDEEDIDETPSTVTPYPKAAE
jgi:multidrug efflux pump